MDRGALRAAVSGYIGGFPSMSHEAMTAAFERLGLPDPGEGTKAQRAQRCVESLRGEQLQPVAEHILAEDGLAASTRFAIEEVLWEDRPGVPALSKRVRRELAEAIDIDRFRAHFDRLMVLLDRLWVLDNNTAAAFVASLAGRPGPGLRGEIERHVGGNPDWSTLRLFEELGAFEATDRRFALLLEGLSSSEVLPDEPGQRQFVEAVNRHLVPVGAELREIDRVDGYPRFALTATGTTTRRPKNIVFASRTKPDIRFTSAVDNDIEILDGEDDVLIYDRPIEPGGLMWAQLQQWWASKHGLDADADADAAKSSLWTRLCSSLPENSPPQRHFFDAYHKVFPAVVPQLPALLPEVWFCWDPKTARQRGTEALLHLRMDFLLLVPGAQRVVIEIDGQTHYARGGRPDPARYAQTMAADRDLKLLGYDVYRFGAHELDTPERAQQTVTEFCQRLFPRYNIPIGP